MPTYSYGFMSAAERDLFRLLVHPRLRHRAEDRPRCPRAGRASPASRQRSCRRCEVAPQVKGIGKKTAERIIVELKDKVGIAAAWEAASADARTFVRQEVHVNDAVLALISLGYKQIDAHKAVKQIIEKQRRRADLRRTRPARAQTSALISPSPGALTNAMDRLNTIRAAFPAEGLFAG